MSEKHRLRVALDMSYLMTLNCVELNQTTDTSDVEIEFCSRTTSDLLHRYSKNYESLEGSVIKKLDRNSYVYHALVKKTLTIWMEESLEKNDNLHKRNNL
jgi:hypothetical protein